MTSNSYRGIAFFDLLNFVLVQVQIQSPDQLVQSISAPYSDDRRCDPRRVKGPSESDFGHGYTSLFSNLLYGADHFGIPGLPKSVRAVYEEA